MTQPIDLAGLNPTARARLIYSQARSEVSDRLWQAAIGEPDRAGENGADPLANGKLVTLDSLLASLTSGKLSSIDGATGQFPLPPVYGPHTAAAPGSSEDLVLPIDRPAEPISGLGINSTYAGTLERAAERSGVPSSALAAIIDAEAAKRSDGSWNLFSRNPRSSAAGLGQFLSGTWIDMAEREGNWLHDVARENGWLDERGRVNSTAKGSLLALRYDAEASINTIADYARSNIEQIRNAGLRTGDGPAALAKLAYLGHHLGPGDAIRFLAGGLSDRRAASLLQAQIGAGRAADRIDEAGSAADAHRRWLNGFMSSHVRPDRFTATAARDYT